MTVDFDTYTDDQLVDYFHQRCLENGGDRTSWLRGKEHSFKQELVNRLPFLSTGKKKAPIYLYIWCLENMVSNFPPCECCGTPVSGFGSKGFHKTCSTECKKILVANTIKSTMTEKYGVDNFTKTESYRKATSDRKKSQYQTEIGAESYRKLQDSQWLSEEYKTKSIRKIATELGVSGITVHRYLKKHGIKTYATGSGLHRNITQEALDFLNNKELLQQEYQASSATALSKRLGVDETTIHNYMKRHGIKSLGVAGGNRRHLSDDHNDILNDVEFLKAAYSEIGVLGIAERIGSSDGVVYRALERHNIPREFGKGVSHKEIELFNFIRSLGFADAVQSDKTVLGTMELDIVIPSKKIAIEFNGLYWHSTRFKERRYHLNKTLASQDSGYRLIHIFEDEWDTRKEQVKEKIKSILGVDDRQPVYARKCSVVEIDDIDKISDFYNKNHIQGSAGQSFTFGLEFNGSVVAMMSFKKRSDTEYELSRYATSHRVVGGFSRILKHSKAVLNEMGVKRLISFADRRYSVGNVYASNGWTHESDAGPDYQYVIRDRRVRKQNFRRKYLPEKIEMFDPNLSEVENMRMNGIYQIYDCGLMKFSLEIG